MIVKKDKEYIIEGIELNKVFRAKILDVTKSSVQYEILDNPKRPTYRVRMEDFEADFVVLEEC